MFHLDVHASGLSALSGRVKPAITDPFAIGSPMPVRHASPPPPQRPLLAYALHSGRLYGTERMALATLMELRATHEPVVLAPPGPALDEASRLGLASAAFSGTWDLVRTMHRLLARHDRIAFLATSLTQSAVFLALNAFHRRSVSHLHVVHGGADERDSYGRKRYLRSLPVRFVAVSEFVRQRLAAHDVPSNRVAVIENFLSDERRGTLPRRPPFSAPGVRRIVVVSRLDPVKRVDLLLDAIEREPRLSNLDVRVLGTGWDEPALRARAARLPNVTFAGFSAEVGRELAAADLLVHLCATEPFGLAVLEAMAVGLPVLVPDAGGAGDLVEDDVTGFRFRADDADALTQRLAVLSTAGADTLNQVVQEAAALLDTRFDPRLRAADYARLIKEDLR